MRKDWLAALTEAALEDDPSEDGGGAKDTEWVLPTGALRALLDEREALLEALSGLENWVTRNVSAEYVVGQLGVRIEALGVARQVLDKVCSP